MLLKAALIALLASSETADVVTTQQAIHRGCVESNPIFGTNPSVGRMLVVKLPVGVLMGHWDLKLANHHKKAAVAVTALVSGVTFAVAAHNRSCR